MVRQYNRTSLQTGIIGVLCIAISLAGGDNRVLSTIGLAFVLAGLCFYAKSKKWHPALGLLGMIPFGGLIVLLLLPDRSDEGKCRRQTDIVWAGFVFFLFLGLPLAIHLMAGRGRNSPGSVACAIAAQASGNLHMIDDRVRLDGIAADDGIVFYTLTIMDLGADEADREMCLKTMRDGIQKRFRASEELAKFLDLGVVFDYTYRGKGGENICHFTIRRANGRDR